MEEEKQEREQEKVESKQELIKCSKSFVPTLTPEENRVLQVKYQSAPFRDLSSEDIKTHSMALLLRISVITGWVIPEDELGDILSDQLRHQMTEKYGAVNVDEVGYAFRTFGTTIKDWGKQMNLSLLDEVMVKYMTLRAEVSRQEQDHKAVLAIPAVREDVSDEGMEKWADELRAQKMPVEFLPELLYEWMIGKEWLTPTRKVKYQYLEKAAAYRLSQLIKATNEAATMENRRALSEFLAMKQADEYSGIEAAGLKALAKKMILFDYLNF